jgi:hypothetical protein
MVTEFRLPAPEVDNGVVELLEALLDQARRGEVLAIAGITLCTGGESGRFMSPSIADETVRAIGMLRVLQMRIEQYVDLGDSRQFSRDDE